MQRERHFEKDGCRAPEPLEELTEKAGTDQMWGYVFQGHAYEGLTVNALEWLVSREAGSIVELKPRCRISVNNPRAAEALTLAASWVGTIAPPDVLNYTEEEARRVFQSGNAVFMRNWPYAWPLVSAAGSPVGDKVEVAPLPRHAAALGARSSRCRGTRATPRRRPPWCGT
jgi:trehalose/maltose transport system substrate-binding protein